MVSYDCVSIKYSLIVEKCLYSRYNNIFIRYALVNSLGEINVSQSTCKCKNISLCTMSDLAADIHSRSLGKMLNRLISIADSLRLRLTFNNRRI